MSKHLTTFAASALALAASFASPGSARADSPVALSARPPVAVTACRVDSGYGYTNSYNTLAFPEVTGLNVRFQNDHAVEASEVDLRVGYLGREETIADKGRFAPATSIDHTFATFLGSPFGSAALSRCDVVAVRYADGTLWQAGSGSPVAAAARLAK